MKTNPWFSTKVEDDENHILVHHDNTSCVDGGRVEKNHHRYGTDNRSLCPECARLDAAGR